MKKGYWVSLYFKIDNQENIKKYSELATPIIKSYGGVPLVRGGKHETFNGDDFSRTVVWEFPSYAKALECHSSKEYQDSWSVAEKTTKSGPIWRQKIARGKRGPPKHSDDHNEFKRSLERAKRRPQGV